MRIPPGKPWMWVCKTSSEEPRAILTSVQDYMKALGALKN